jgi:hypothetical protein
MQILPESERANDLGFRLSLQEYCSISKWAVLSVPRGIKSPDPPGRQPSDLAIVTVSAWVNLPRKNQKEIRNPRVGTDSDVLGFSLGQPSPQKPKRNTQPTGRN